jgi:hypothetical protein
VRNWLQHLFSRRVRDEWYGFPIRTDVRCVCGRLGIICPDCPPKKRLDREGEGEPRQMNPEFRGEDREGEDG